eukprot:scpid4855/ scgid23219/ 
MMPLMGNGAQAHDMHDMLHTLQEKRFSLSCFTASFGEQYRISALPEQYQVARAGREKRDRTAKKVFQLRYLKTFVFSGDIFTEFPTSAVNVKIIIIIAFHVVH